ncbi:MAG: site-specific integrase [Planctomycetes bacterium]|nr:site-specific integrase [Planctomycetota bacterium]
MTPPLHSTYTALGGATWHGSNTKGTFFASDSGSVAGSSSLRSRPRRKRRRTAGSPASRRISGSQNADGWRYPLTPMSGFSSFPMARSTAGPRRRIARSPRRSPNSSPATATITPRPPRKTTLATQNGFTWPILSVCSVHGRSYMQSQPKRSKRMSRPGRRRRASAGRPSVAVPSRRNWGRLQWAIPQGLASLPLPTKFLAFGKEKAKPPFQTRVQIERQIGRGGLSDEEQQSLWNCLFLTLPEVDEVLEFLRKKRCPAFVYPLFAFAAHTGARRSEMLRSRIDDFDFSANVVTIREKKRDRDKEETYRTVPLTPLLTDAMRTWFAVHSGGPFTVCTPTGKAISKQLAARTFVRVLRKSAWEVLPGWHCFRHSFISNCVAKGIDQRLIDQWVGHSTETMRRRYSHLIPKTSQDALKSVFG